MAHLKLPDPHRLLQSSQPPIGEQGLREVRYLSRGHTASKEHRSEPRPRSLEGPCSWQLCQAHGDSPWVSSQGHRLSNPCVLDPEPSFLYSQKVGSVCNQLPQSISGWSNCSFHLVLSPSLPAGAGSVSAGLTGAGCRMGLSCHGDQFLLILHTTL